MADTYAILGDTVLQHWIYVVYGFNELVEPSLITQHVAKYEHSKSFPNESECIVEWASFHSFHAIHDISCLQLTNPSLTNHIVTYQVI